MFFKEDCIVVSQQIIYGTRIRKHKIQIVAVFYVIHKRRIVFTAFPRYILLYPYHFFTLQVFFEVHFIKKSWPPATYAADGQQKGGGTNSGGVRQPLSVYFITAAGYSLKK